MSNALRSPRDANMKDNLCACVDIYIYFYLIYFHFPVGPEFEDWERM